MLHPCCEDHWEQMTEIFVIFALQILYCHTWCLPVLCLECGNRCTQVYATDFWLTRSFPKASRSKVDEMSLLLFALDGSPSTCICNNAKDMVQRKFYESTKMLHVTWKSWSHILSGHMLKKDSEKLKKGFGHKLMWFRAPKCLWDNCLHLETYLRSNTTNDIYKLDREVPKTVM